MPSSDMDAFRSVLQNSRNIIAVCGAGLSAASGIPTFRGAGGLWRRYDAMSLATPEAFEENPSRVWQFYHYRREFALKAKPNAAHYALGLVTQHDIRRKIAPKSARFTLITQNVDGLSPRAHASLPDQVAARTNTYEMHGRVHDTICLSCGARNYDTRSPICEALNGTEQHVADDASTEEKVIPLDSLPRCTKPDCHGLLRPGVVWFGETPLHMEELDEFVSRADLCLVIGTSSTVYPAAGYASDVQENGGKVAIFNLEKTRGDEDADFLSLGKCEETLPAALGLQTEVEALQASATSV